MKIIETHIVKKLKERVRIQEYAVDIFDNINSKSALKKAIKQNRVLLNGDFSTTANFINIGDKIELLEKKKLIKKPFYIDFDIIYEDDFLSVINKPAGVSVSGNKFATIANALPNYLYNSPINDAIQAHPVHRLDYHTSGLLLIAKTASTQVLLHKMFENKEIDKTYYAVVVNKIKNTEGELNFNIDNKSAKTLYKVIKSLESERFESLSLIELKPITGRTHQLRKHMLGMGNPIMGDKKYFLPNRVHKGNGLYLHAKSLKFKHPISKELMIFHAVLPKKFKRLFSK